MQISREIALRHWLKATEEQLTLDLSRKGYDIRTDERVGDYQFDLSARKDDELIVIELKGGAWDADRSRQALALRNYVVQELGGKFEIFFVTPPGEVDVEVQGINQILLQILWDDPGSLQDLATHVQINEVDGIEIESMHVSENQVRISGAAMVYIDLQYGSNSDNKKDMGAHSSDSYPFSFSISLDASLNIIGVESVEIDTSSFYE